MRKLRIGNLKYFSALPYRLLKDEGDIDYNEYFPAETADLLHAGLLDVAHIPASEFIRHGGYVGLDFGLAAERMIDEVVLVAREPLHHVRTIYYDSMSRSGQVLLRLLLRQRWVLDPLVIPCSFTESLLPGVGPVDLNNLAEGEAALLIGNNALKLRDDFAFVIDLATAWYDWTKQPFVFTIWAARPGALSRDEGARLNEIFHKGTKARGSLARDSSSELDISKGEAARHVAKVVQYYLDSNAKAGLSNFGNKCHSCGLLPDTPYKSASFSVLPQPGKRKSTASLRSVVSILERALDGKRMSVAEAERLATEAALPDLCMAADALRTQRSPNRYVSLIVVATDADLQREDWVEQVLSSFGTCGASSVRILLKDPKLEDITRYRQSFAKLKAHNINLIEAFTIGQLIELSVNCKIDFATLVNQLIEAGLTTVSGADVNNLTLNIESCSKIETFRRKISACQHLHRSGVKTSASMIVKPDQTWEQRLVYLDILRTLQDDCGAISSFSLNYEFDLDDASVSEMKTRLTCLSRIFLDNFQNITDGDITSNPVSGILSLSVGANEIRIPVYKLGEKEVRDALGLLRTLWGIGMDIEEGLLNIAPRPLLH